MTTMIVRSHRKVVRTYRVKSHNSLLHAKRTPDNWRCCCFNVSVLVLAPPNFSVILVRVEFTGSFLNKFFWTCPLQWRHSSQFGVSRVARSIRLYGRAFFSILTAVTEFTQRRFSNNLRVALPPSFYRKFSLCIFISSTVSPSLHIQKNIRPPYSYQKTHIMVNQIVSSPSQVLKKN